MNLFSEIQLERANKLLDLLNEDLKPKEKYKPIAVFTENGFDIYICGNYRKEILFNILDFDGNFPNGFSACWRNFGHIKQDLKLKTIRNEKRRQTN